ncbi:hypothetical protein BOSEA1005_10247 [Hyphomicrobiales bacterium]|nr:hypothetical protein BOSEA1005_10247 [Hyphomicrobiales bacterium]CAI0342778.1 hypothetical protein BO1005MUT1_10071 [Hyphomicrobiales bacterium]
MQAASAWSRQAARWAFWNLPQPARPAAPTSPSAMRASFARRICIKCEAFDERFLNRLRPGRHSRVNFAKVVNRVLIRAARALTGGSGEAARRLASCREGQPPPRGA